MSTESKPPEIIAIASGKGGTGKTLLAACLAHALARAGHSVLLVDADTATDGLSLFLLAGAAGSGAPKLARESTLLGYLEQFASQGHAELEVQRIERAVVGHDSVAFQLLVSRAGLQPLMAAESAPPSPHLGQQPFRAAIQALFQRLRELPYDYVLVDTRGGSGFESSELCGLADGFILVTHPDPTSFLQDRRLLHQVSRVGIALERRTVLRSIFVNRARDGDAKPFRLELEREFGVALANTHALPFDLEVLRAYELQKLPYELEIGSAFSHASLVAFADIFQLVTAPWPTERVQRWNALVVEASEAFAARNLAGQEAEAAAAVERQWLIADGERLPLQLRERPDWPSRWKTALVSVVIASALGAAALALWPAPPPATQPPVLQSQAALRASGPPPTDKLGFAPPEAPAPALGVAAPAAESSSLAGAEALPPPGPRRPAPPPARESVRNEGKRPPSPPASSPGTLAEPPAPPRERAEWSDFGGRK